MKAKLAKEPGTVAVEFNPAAEPRISAAFLSAWRLVPPVKFYSILATTDFSDLSMEAVEYAVALAEEFEARLSLMYVVEPAPHVGGFESVVLIRADPEIIKRERKHLSKLAKGLSRRAARIRPVVRYGKAVREIAAEASNQKVDLIITATRGHTGLKRVLLGSTAEAIVRHAPCPVLTVPAETANRMTGKRWTSRIKRIMVPIDFSETSANALPFAAALASKFRAEILLIHVTEPPHASDSFIDVPSARMTAEANRAAEEMLSRVQREAFSDEIQTQAVIRSGTPFHEITRAAARSEADLIILTTHGRTGLKHALIGSTAERTVRHAGCPVLVVRDKKSKRNGDRRKR